MILSLDCETTKFPAALPWIPNAVLSCISYTTDAGEQGTFWFNHNLKACDPYEDNIRALQELIDAADIVVGHNIKFDLHWFKFIGLDFTSAPVFCTMVGEYLCRNHRLERSLSLAEIATERGCTAKLDIVKAMWDEGYDTLDIPPDILQEYCEGDTKTCLEIFFQQFGEIKGSGKMMIAYLDMAALKLFQEAEYHGMKLDVDKLEQFKVQYSMELEEIDTYLKEALDIDNPGSSDQLSCGLFGGTYQVEGRVPGKREGTTKKGKIPRYVQGLGFKPVGPEGAKEGIYSTAMDVLLRLKARTPEQKRALELLKRRSRASQMLSTFVNGLLRRVGEDGIVHQTKNQTITNTGRLSSSDPNLENIPRGNTSPIKEAFISRYGIDAVQAVIKNAFLS